MANKLKKAKRKIKENIRKGITCPCCGLFVKQYKRKLNSTMCLSLLNLYKLNKNNEDYHHITIIEPSKAGTGELSKLAYWGLVESQVNESTSKRCSGFWRITPKGKKFAKGEIALPKHCIVFNKELIRLDGTEQVKITDALGDRFNYQELMRG